MSKMFTDLQRRIMARAISQSVSETIYLRKGHFPATRSLIEKGFLDQHAYGMIQTQHVTPEGKAAFFTEHGDVFAIQDIYDNYWIIFEDRKVIAKPRSEENAKRIVTALKVLRQQERLEQKAAA
ncbi:MULTISPECIES: hypothetical protein [unclassified Bradyrhizobium]|uniref:hypothetical protein n=1 Tax=unclassified Bradyrhizobium TaxID=2631580 RepID=UPI002916A427|nr:MULTISPECIES: hypothetical protein [unclassified Bradyrhizobium]